MMPDGRSRGDRPKRELDDSEVWQFFVTKAPIIFNAMRRENPQQRIDFSDEDIVDFSLENIDLYNANLSQAHFRNCDLRGADFRGAELRETKFSNCKLEGAQFDENENDATFEDCSR